MHRETMYSASFCCVMPASVSFFSDVLPMMVPPHSPTTSARPVIASTKLNWLQSQQGRHGTDHRKEIVSVSFK